MAAAWATASAGLDHLLVIPSYRHPLKTGDRTPYEDRVILCELAFEGLRHVTVSRIEEELGESRTLFTLEALIDQEPERQLRLVIGADILEETHRWYQWERVSELAPPLLIGRAGYESEAAVDLPAVSSTDIRARLRQGASVEGLVPRRVIEHVASHRLYR